MPVDKVRALVIFSPYFLITFYVEVYRQTQPQILLGLVDNLAKDIESKNATKNERNWMRTL
jgi:hypothetical protein